MARKASTLKLNLIILCMIWSISGTYGILVSFEIKGLLLVVLLTLLTVLSMLFLFKKYKPLVRNCINYRNYIVCGSKYIYEDDILESYEVTPIEKMAFTLKSPEFDFSAGFFKKGLVLKTLYDSFLIDNLSLTFLENSKSRRVKNIGIYNILYILLWIFPVIAPVLSIYLGIDPMAYASIMVFFILVAVMRLMPPFYLGKKLDHKSLPLSAEELKEFKNITIIQGFVMSDRLAVLPFKKASYLDGLAVDILFKGYIVLNPRIFAMGSSDYVRFVIFHELCHIRHHDSLNAITVPAAIIILDFLISISPNSTVLWIESHLPYYDFILIGAAIAYITVQIIKRKGMEQRADRYGMARIGEDGISRIHSKLGIDLRPRA